MGESDEAKNPVIGQAGRWPSPTWGRIVVESRVFEWLPSVCEHPVCKPWC